MMLLELQMELSVSRDAVISVLEYYEEWVWAKWNDKVGLYLFGLWIRKALSRVHT